MSPLETEPSTETATVADTETAEDGESALYRLLFAVAAFFYVAWWPINRVTMHGSIDPLWERCAIGAIALAGYVTATRTRWKRLPPWFAEAVIYAITVHYFSLIVRNSFNAQLQIGIFITLSSIGLVPRHVRFTVIYAAVATTMAAAACWVGQVSVSNWALVFGGVATLEAVSLGIGLRVHRVTVARERAERATIAAKEAAVRAAAAKDQLLAKVSHELRTPMNGVVNMVQLAQDGPLTPAQQEYLETANTCAEDMLKIINDLLDLSKAEAGRMTLHPMRFSMAEMLERALKELVLRAAAKGISMHVLVRPDVPDRLLGDGLRLQQVLINLIGNAVKFTEQGSIDVEIAAQPEPGQPSKLRLSFEVKDTGPGIPADRIKQVFVAFAQADGSVTRRFGGTGLGLTISTELVELMGGHLTVTSELGVGSVFRFDALLERAPPELTLSQQPSAAPEPPRLASQRLAILVADDNLTNERIVRALLERAGHEVVAVGDGRRVLDALSGRDFDVVLLDVQMPELDGYEVTRRIRAGAVPGKETIPLIAITAQAIEGDRERCLERGMDAYLSKPVDRDLLIRTVERLAAERRPAAIDEADLHRRIGSDPELLATVLSTYQQESRVLFASIEKAVAEQASTPLRHVAHNLKGALLTLGANDAARAAATLEQLGASGNWGSHDLALATLGRELERVNAFIERRFGSLAAPGIAS